MRALRVRWRPVFLLKRYPEFLLNPCERRIQGLGEMRPLGRINGPGLIPSTPRGLRGDWAGYGVEGDPCPAQIGWTSPFSPAHWTQNRPDDERISSSGRWQRKMVLSKMRLYFRGSSNPLDKQSVKSQRVEARFRRRSSRRRVKRPRSHRFPCFQSAPESSARHFNTGECRCFSSRKSSKSAR